MSDYKAIPGEAEHMLCKHASKQLPSGAAQGEPYGQL